MDNLSVEAVAAGDISLDLLTTELVEHARTQSSRALGNRIAAYLLAGGFLGAAIATATLAPAAELLAGRSSCRDRHLRRRLARHLRGGKRLRRRDAARPRADALRASAARRAAHRRGGLCSRRAAVLRAWRIPLNQWPIDVFDASYSIGPALVLAFAHAREPRWHDAPVYVGAFAAQLTVDFVPNAIWSRHAWRIPLLEQMRSMRTSVLVDCALAPVGLVVAFASRGQVWGLFAVLPLVVLLHVFARERQGRLDHALELSAAYRGTAMLLGEMIEADDEYTGSHSRDVVDLVLAVSDKLNLDPRTRRQAEFAALLHDVGKVKIPAEIINKPGKLDGDEWALIKTHTVLGEEMLGQVGGLLGNVGHIVRSSHERWDGRGYPDGLVGEAIPIAARVVSACDAWSAMTTDRAYRSRLTDEEAALELRVCSGTQFDPRVVEVLLDVLSS